MRPELDRFPPGKLEGSSKHPIYKDVNHLDRYGTCVQNEHLSHWSRWILAWAFALSLFAQAGCGLRTISPIRFLPILGKEKEISTTDVLVRALKDRDVSRRAEAVDLLGLLSQGPDKGIKKEVARVLGMGLRDSDPGLRLQVVEKLGAMESEIANRYLFGALKDPNPFVREKVLSVLGDRERTKADIPSAQN